MFSLTNGNRNGSNPGKGVNETRYFDDQRRLETTQMLLTGRLDSVTSFCAIFHSK